MLDVELDEKIQIFRGKKDEAKDDDYDSGKLLEDEENEDVHVNSTTYEKIVKMSGGMPFMVVLILAQIGNEAFDGWSSSVRNTWATQPAQ